MLKIKTTHTLTTDELRVYCDPPLTFEAIGNIDPRTQEDLRTWHQANYPPEQAVGFVSRLFLSFSVDGKTYPLATIDDVAVLRDAVGDTWLADLVERFWDYEFNFFKKKQADSVSLLPASEIGTPPAS